MAFAAYYDSNDAGLGGVANTAGSLISFLDKVLINGYNAQTLTSMTRAGSTLVTATLVSHGYRDRQLVTITGATPSDYNGTWQVVVGSTTANTFQFNVSTSATDAATGTLSCIVAPLGYTKPYSGTNLAAYQAAVGNKLPLRVDDTGTTTATVKMYETMTDINTGTNVIPTVLQNQVMYVSKGNTTTRRCILWGNGSLLYFFSDYTGDSSSGVVGLIWGDFTSYKTSDSWNTVLAAGSAAGTGEPHQVILAASLNGSSGFSVAQTAHYLARSHPQTPGAAPCGKTVDQRFTNNALTINGSTGAIATNIGSSIWNMAYPAPVDGNLWTSDVGLTEISANMSPVPRGKLTGIQAPLHTRPLTNYSIYTGAGALAGKDYLAINLGATGQILAEVSNTW